MPLSQGVTTHYPNKLTKFIRAKLEEEVGVDNSDVKALVFDVLGTVVDWCSITISVLSARSADQLNLLRLLSLNPAHVGDQFVRAHPLGETVADRDNPDI